MGYFTETMKEREAVAWVTTATINGGSTATSSSGYLDMGNMRRVRAFLVCGTLTGSASVNFAIQASAASGSGFAAITTLTTNPSITGITTDDSINAIEISADLLPSGTRYIKAIATETASANAVVTIIVIADDPSYHPGSAFNTATFTNNVLASV